MSTMEVEIISTETIKPSSPTPNHLTNFKLCLLDHLIPAAYAPIIIFYPNPGYHQVQERSALLKKSLSETLTRFFPLAGTIIDDLSIDCNDQGASFTTAKVNCRLNDFLECPDLKFLAQFLPCGLTSSGFSVTNVQLTEFECGGIALGVCVSHRVLDGTALGTFLKSWASSAASSSSDQEEESILPDFSASHLFPCNDSWLQDASITLWGLLFKKGKFVTKRFGFGSSAIASLKEKATGGSTGVEAVSGLIWKSAMAASEARFGYKKPSLLTHIVNLRRRAVPNFSQHSIGNLIWIASAKCGGEKGNLQLGQVVDEVRKGISAIDGEYVKKLRGEEGGNAMRKDLKEMEEFGRKDVDHFGFTSWCKLGFYGVDFGFGRPVWVASIDASGPFFMNLAVLVDTRCGDGIEAWVTMDEEEMSILEDDQEFTSFASLNPSPL
ncbi:hypothetical protein ACS0TY_013894 [Phlomoides rotata]